ncbi:conserved protein of unknown function [Tenacibaculum aestuariivivum]
MFQELAAFFKNIFSNKCTLEECLKEAKEKGIFYYTDEGRTKEMLSYNEIINMLKHYDSTRIAPVEKILGYEDSRVNTFNFVQFKKYLAHVENLSKKSGVEITGISFISVVKSNYNGKEKGYSSLIYIPSTTLKGVQVLFDPVQTAEQGKLVTFKEMLLKHGYNWIYDSEREYEKGKRKDNNYNLQSENNQIANSARGPQGDAGSGAGNYSQICPPYK